MIDRGAGRSAAAWATLVCVTTGCSSAYIPRAGPRLSMVIDGGSVAYQRDGKRYEGGLFGGELEEAVKGNPKAEEYAHQFRSGMIGGFAGLMLGLGGILGGAALAGAESSQPNAAPNAGVPGLAVMGAGLAAYLVGLGFMMSSAPHAYDAVNAYNDGLEENGGHPPSDASGTAPRTP